MNNNITVKIVRCAVISALYFCLTLFPFSHGIVQLRLSEGLVLLPMILPESILGITLGCALGNITSPFGIIDVIVGSSVTFIAGFLTSKIKNVFIAPLPPILLNAFILPVVWMLVGVEQIYIINVLSLLLSQSIVIYGLGVPLTKYLLKNKKLFN